MNIEGLVQKDDPRRKADTPRGEAVRRESPNKSRSAIKPASPKRVLQGTLGKKNSTMYKDEKDASRKK